MSVIGRGAPSFVAEVPRLLGVEEAALTFVTYRPRPPLEERLPPDAASRDFAKEALRHSGYPIPPQSVRAEDLGSFLNRPLTPGEVLGICSRVSTSMGEKHMLLLDFKVAVSSESQTTLVEAMRQLGEKRGVLLNSGRSYHWYGLDLLTLEAWRLRMTAALLLAPLTDVRYLAHCLLETVACLRISASPARPLVPTVVETLGL